jgi:predicted  nucleic acid-binding Zn-ribbon protein
MPINSIKNNTIVPMNDIRQERSKLSKLKNDLSQNLSDIRNCVTKLNKSITAHNKNIAGNQSLLKSLQSVSAKHGEDASVRLKNDHFKYGQASNFFKNTFHGNRYQTEREAAVKMVNAEGSKVSAGMVINTLQSKIDSALSEVNELKKEVAGYDKKIDDIEARKYGIEKKIDKFAKIETDAKKADEKNHKARQEFSMIYQSNVGFKAINVEARHQFSNAPSAGKVSGNKVVEEYRRVHGYEIFSRGNKVLESTIKTNCSNLSELVKTGAKAWYTPTGKNITTYRGQGITPSGINKLISRFDADKQNKTETVYNLGQFFSTSRHVNVASDFAKRSPDSEKVIFKVKGNSSNGLSVPGGLSFENDEGERLYSPLANFKVTAVSRVASNTYNVTLEEVTKGDKAQPLPY